MIRYETFCQIKDLHQRQGLNAQQIATALGVHRHTVAKWLAEPHYRARRSAPRRSKLDPYKPDIVRWLDSHPLSAVQTFQRLREQGYDGGYSIVTDYVRQIRPPSPTRLSEAGLCSR